MMITIQSKMLVEEKVAKRTKYSEGVGAKEAKMSSVKKVIMLALLPNVKETHENLKTLLTAVDLSGIPFTFSCDIKLDLMLIGKQQASCTHNCIYCTGAAPWTDQNSGDLMTIGMLKCFHRLYLERDPEDEEKEADFNNCVDDNLLQLHFPDEMYVIDAINIPELHILMGVVVKLLDYIKSLFGKDQEDKSRGAAFVHQYLTSLNITQKTPGRLEGNQAEKIAQNSGQLLLLADQLPQEISDRVKNVAPVLEAFNRVKHSCFGQRIYGDYVGEIARFSSLYRSLPGITKPPKFHMLESHVETFLTRRQAEGFVDHGLSFWGEQQFESSHHDFKVCWERRKLGDQHENYVAALSDAFLEWNSSHI